MKCICHNVYIYDIVDYIIDNNLTVEEALAMGFFGQHCRFCIEHVIKKLEER